MQTTTTVADVRALYEGLASSPEAFLSELNEITYRLANNDLWKGFTDEVLFPASTEGFIVLPRQYVAILGYDWNSVPMPVFGRFHQYIEQGIGWQDETEMTMAGLIEDGWVVTQTPPTGTFTLRVKITAAADAGKVMRFYGDDAQTTSQPVQTNGVDGVNLTLANPSADTTQQFTSVTGIQAPLMDGPWTLWQVVSGVETQIGLYQPGETRPSYRRYKIGVRTDQDVIRCFCRRQWVKSIAETDWVWPGCLSAIKLGFKALSLEDATKYGSENEPNADGMWERSYAEVDKELAVIRGYEVPTLRMFGGPYPRYNFIVN